MQVLDEEGCMENSRVNGTRLLRALAPLREEFAVVGDVRGKGLMIGVELVQDREKRLPLPLAQVNSVLDRCREMGLLIGRGGQHGNALRIKPPMCITEADVDFTVAVIREALRQLAAEQ